MRRTLALALAALVCASCGASADAPAAAPSGSPPRGDHEGEWKLESGRGPEGPIRVVSGYPITLEIQGDEISGRSGCNSYGGRVTIEGSSFSADGIAGTEMGCTEPGVAESEAAFVAALPASEELEVRGDDLVLTGPDTKLTFRRVAPVPAADLAGTPWKLESLVDGAGPAGTATAAAPARLKLSRDGTYAATTGCRRLSGTWSEVGGRIELEGARARRECPGQLEEQDRHVLDVLRRPFTAAIEERTLTITGSSGRGLVYLAGGGR